MKKPNYIATPVLINVLQESKRSYNDGIVYLSYDTDKIFLEVYLYDDDQLTISMYIGSDKQITIKNEQQDHVYNFIQEFYKEKREKHSSEYIQDCKDDLNYHDIKFDQTS